MDLKEYSFKNLSIPERAQLLEARGMYLAERSYFSFAVSLYAVGDSFVEVWYNFYEDDVQCIEVLDLMKVPDFYPKLVELTAGGVLLQAEKQGRNYLSIPFYTREERWESDKMWMRYFGPYGSEGPTLDIQADTLRYRIRRRYLLFRRQWLKQIRSIFRILRIS